MDWPITSWTVEPPADQEQEEDDVWEMSDSDDTTCTLDEPRWKQRIDLGDGDCKWDIEHTL